MRGVSNAFIEGGSLISNVSIFWGCKRDLWGVWRRYEICLRVCNVAAGKIVQVLKLCLGWFEEFVRLLPLYDTTSKLD